MHAKRRKNGSLEGSSLAVYPLLKKLQDPPIVIVPENPF